MNREKPCQRQTAGQPMFFRDVFMDIREEMRKKFPVFPNKPVLARPKKTGITFELI
jgi:hypothetical protein